jgi:predicted Zn-dependent protease
MDPASHSGASRATSTRWLRRAAILALGCGAGAAVMLQVAQSAYARGQEAARAGGWSQAAAHYARAVRWNPLSAHYAAAHSAALVRLTPPQVDRAAAGLHRAMSLDRMNAALPIQLAAMLIEHTRDARGRQEAEVWLRRALALDSLNRPEAYRLLAGLYLQQDRAVEAAQVYREALGLYLGRGFGQGSPLYSLLWPEVVAVATDAADLHVRRGDLVQAAWVLQLLLADNPGTVPAAIRLGRVYLTMGRKDEARAVLLAAAGHVPNSQELQQALEALR